MGKLETSLGVKIADKTNDRPSTVKRGSARKVAHFGSWPSMER